MKFKHWAVVIIALIALIGGFTAFTLADFPTFSRDFICHRCNQNKVSPLQDTNISITTTLSGTYLSDYYPKSWSLVDANNGIVSSYNSTYNKITWNGDVNKTWYILYAPDKTTPPTDYYFQTEKEGIFSNWHEVKITDDPEGNETNETIDPNSLIEGNSPTQTGSFWFNLSSSYNKVGYNESQDNLGRSIWTESFNDNTNKTFYITLPKNSNITSAYFNLTGNYENGNWEKSFIADCSMSSGNNLTYDAVGNDTYVWTIEHIDGTETTQQIKRYFRNNCSLDAILNSNVTPQDSDMDLICLSGTDIWTYGDANTKVYKYSSTGQYQSTSFSVSQIHIDRGMTCNSTHIFIGDYPLSGNQSVKYWTTGGTYKGILMNMSENIGIYDIGTNNSYIWVDTYSVLIGGQILKRYFMNGTDTSWSSNWNTIENINEAMTDTNGKYFLRKPYLNYGGFTVDIISRPTNVYSQTNSSTIFNQTGAFSTQNTTSNFRTQMNNNLMACTSNVNGTCNVAVLTHSDNASMIDFSSINITYDYNTSYLYNIINSWSSSTITVNQAYNRTHNLSSTGNNISAQMNTSGFYLEYPDLSTACGNSIDNGTINSSTCNISRMYNKGTYFDEVFFETLIPIYEMTIVSGMCDPGYAEFGKYCTKTNFTEDTNHYYYQSFLNVTQNTTKDYNVTYQIPVGRLNDWGKQNGHSTTVNGTSTGVTTSYDTNYYYVTIDTTYGSSSLEQGIYRVDLHYTTPVGSGGGGGGGGGVTIYNLTNVTVSGYCGDGICGISENVTSCPLDCKPIEYPQTAQFFLLIIGLAIAYIIYKSRKRNTNIKRI